MLEHPRCYKTSPHLGFTLVELVTTLVLIGILAVAVVPRMVGRETFDARGYFEETASALRYSQKLAIATSCPVRVTLGAGGYALFQPTAVCPVSPAVAPDFNAPIANPVGTGAFAKAPPSGVALTSNTAQFFFCPQGHVAAAAANCPAGTALGANVTVTVDAHALAVFASSGYVQMP